MKISAGQISLQGSHYWRQEHTQQESVRAWVGDTRPDFSDDAADKLQTMPVTDRVSLSEEAIRQRFAVTKTTETYTEPQEEISSEDPKIRSIRLVLESLTGKKINIAHFEESPAALPSSPEGPAPETPPRLGWGLEYDYFESFSEREQTQFSAQGTILTEDGQEVAFALQFSLQREFIETNSISIRAGDALVDPLVVNFAGPAAQLTDMKFDFDLTGDGRDESISFVTPGSGFLFLDKNGDGKATNGSELFGPQSNNGFKELAQHDMDGNGWIDETDPIYDKLAIWSKDAAGTDYFSSLAEKNIGALLLASESTEFHLKNEANVLNGIISRSSIFLTEDYRPGTVQEIHLTI